MFLGEFMVSITSLRYSMMLISLFLICSVVYCGALCSSNSSEPTDGAVIQNWSVTCREAVLSLFGTSFSPCKQQQQPRFPSYLKQQQHITCALFDMGNSEAEMEEDETEWRSSFVDSAPLSPAAASGKGWETDTRQIFKKMCWGFYMQRETLLCLLAIYTCQIIFIYRLTLYLRLVASAASSYFYPGVTLISVDCKNSLFFQECIEK